MRNRELGWLVDVGRWRGGAGVGGELWMGVRDVVRWLSMVDGGVEDDYQWTTDVTRCGESKARRRH